LYSKRFIALLVLKTLATVLVHTRLRQNEVSCEHILVHDDGLTALRLQPYRIQSTLFSYIADLPGDLPFGKLKKRISLVYWLSLYNRRLQQSKTTCKNTSQHITMQIIVILHLSVVWENPTLTLNVNLLICAMSIICATLHITEEANVVCEITAISRAMSFESLLSSSV
jgi:hypothetical protein